MADPVTDQPQPTASQETAEVSEAEAVGAEAGVVKSTSWWGVSSLTSYLASPHLLEQGINNVASSVAQVRLRLRSRLLLTVAGFNKLNGRDQTMLLRNP